MYKNAASLVTLLAAFAGMAACGQKGPLYLPDSTGEVVTRPAATPPAEASATENTEAPNSPQTPDSQPAPPPPAPEVGTDEPKKDKGASPPAPK